ncbi:unnamed protein product [Pedinophyceae sp. YPF-701]|nr:unnamed protein product [Pedinophyceae sp. YPF-701]
MAWRVCRASFGLARLLRLDGGVPMPQMAAAAAPDALAHGAGHASVAATRGVTSHVYDVGSASNIKWHEGMVARRHKEALLGQKGVILWFTGLSGSGKSTVACTLEHALHKLGRHTVLLDGDNVRHGLNANLGFSPEDRKENIRRIGEVSKLFAESGAITLVSFISPYRADRDAVRARVQAGDFVEVYMQTSLQVCEQRDPKGLYKAARAGKIKCFTGIDDPYEEPVAPEIALHATCADGEAQPPQKLAAEILKYLESHGYLEPPADPGSDSD